MNYESIQESINALKDRGSKKEDEAMLTLHAQLVRASCAQYTRDELALELKQENDVLESFDQDSAFFESVRQIQDSIINFYGE